MKKDNIIKKSVSGIEMTDEQKARITQACKQACNRNTYFNRRLAAVMVCVLLLATMAFTGIAARQYLKNSTQNKPHIPEDKMSEEPSVTEDEDGSGYYITCNGVSGDGEKVYFDMTLGKQDDGVILKTNDGVDVIRCRPFDARLEFEDGYQKEVYFFMLDDSTDLSYHFEAFALFYSDEKHYIGQDAKLYIGDVTADLSDDTSVVVCSFTEPVSVNVTADTGMRTVDFDEGEFAILDGGFEFGYVEITATTVTLYGKCYIEGPVYEMEEIMDNAYLICNGEQVLLGTKHGGGTTVDGVDTVSWQNATLIDPDAVTAICIDGVTVYLD